MADAGKPSTIRRPGGRHTNASAARRSVKQEMAVTIIASFHGWLDRWAPLADWVVAGGTLTLAIATFVLARRARQEGENVRADVELQREAMEQGSRAYVFPHAPW